MWGRYGGSTCVKTLPFSEVLGSTPVDFKKFLHYKKGGSTWRPLAGPRGTLSFSTIHACMCQTKIGPCPPLANLAAKSAEMSHVHVILYSRMVSCHVAYTDCTVSICMFGKTYRMQYLSHTNYV
jgi:hypothetical protein